MSADTLIEVQDLSCSYGENLAVDGISFELRKGEVLGFLGPNGAGKSTTMQMLTGNLAPDAGRILINGIDLIDRPREAKHEIGYLPEQPPVYRELKVREYLNYCARLHGVARAQLRAAVERAAERCGLADVLGRLIGNLSKGYQQRVGIAQAILHSPAVVILDEPTVGLDPIQIREIRDLIRDLGREHGVILSTHILSEVQSVCNRVQIIRQGELVFSAAMDEVGRMQRTGALEVGFTGDPGAEVLAAVAGVERVESLGEGRYHLRGEAAAITPALLERAQAGGWGLTELIPERRTLESIFVQLIHGGVDAGEDPAVAGLEPIHAQEDAA